MTALYDYYEDNYEEVCEAYIEETEEKIRDFGKTNDDDYLRDIKPLDNDWINDYIQMKIDIARDEETDRRIEQYREEELEGSQNA